MKSPKHRPLTLPSLRGIMGDWVYYSCLMNLRDLAGRVNFANEIHKNKRLSDMIQRALKQSRSKQIATYLEDQKERFFNSLVVATYGGNPNWLALSDVKDTAGSRVLNFDEDVVSSVGFLMLQGDERLFALDGQHRLAGIKRAVTESLVEEPFDELSVIFVAHKETSKGLERTRRLFTTLNKTARPVSKGDIIALDEDDVMAITVRRLIEETKPFSGEKIAFVANNNIPPSNSSSLTTIGNLYDILALLFSSKSTIPGLVRNKADLRRVRPSDEVLDKYFEFTQAYFVGLGKTFKELGEFFNARQSNLSVVRKYRGTHGGSAVFRPIGLDTFTRVIVQLTKEMSLADAIKLSAKLPRKLNEEPYVELIWNPTTKTITSAHKATLREVLLHMLGRSKKPAKQLTEEYRARTGIEDAELPSPIV